MVTAIFFFYKLYIGNRCVIITQHQFFEKTNDLSTYNNILLYEPTIIISVLHADIMFCYARLLYNLYVAHSVNLINDLTYYIL